LNETPRGTPSSGLAAAIILACMALWTVLPTLLLSAPHGDNVEQLNWSHAVQWGYSKHPPLPTWLLCGAIEIFGRTAMLTYALAMTCVGLALAAVWLCARELMEREVALAALLFSSANYYLMGRGSFLNHNTVMLPFIAISAWAVIRIVRGASWRVWLLLGLVQALGLLTKYQMCVTILASALALLVAGVHRRPGFAKNLALATAATLMPLIPHGLWLASHQFSSFEYAGHSLLAALGAAERLRAVSGFFFQQVGRLAPAIAAFLLFLAFKWLMPHRAAHAIVEPEAEAGEEAAAVARALAMLALAPLATIVLIGLALGVALQNHWGTASTLLLPLWLCFLGRKRLTWTFGPAAAAVATVHVAAATWNLAAWAYHPGPHHLFAARPLASLVQAYWAQYHEGNVPVLLGPDWEAGSISLYLPGQPAVVPDGILALAPWVDPNRFRACGGVIIGRPGVPLEAQIAGVDATALGDREILSSRNDLGRVSTIQVATLSPSADSPGPTQLDCH